MELGTGEIFTITLYFKPPFYFYPGSSSHPTFTGCVVYLLRDWRKRKMEATPTRQVNF
jgi:hypothetical protein